MDSADALRTIAAFRLAMPRTVLRYAGGRELTLGDLGTRDGLLGGINAVIVGNYLTTLGRDADEDLALLSDLKMPIKELAKTLSERDERATVLRPVRRTAGRARPHRVCPALVLEPPRFCTRCRRRMKVQVTPAAGPPPAWSTAS